MSGATTAVAAIPAAANPDAAAALTAHTLTTHSSSARTYDTRSTTCKSPNNAKTSNQSAKEAALNSCGRKSDTCSMPPCAPGAGVGRDEYLDVKCDVKCRDEYLDVKCECGRTCRVSVAHLLR